MTEQKILRGNSLWLFWCAKVIDEVENLLAMHLILDANCLQVFVIESEEGSQVDLESHSE
jgi:hypothetical protein